MTESSIQDALYHRSILKQHGGLTPNVHLFDWECDFVSITRSGYIHEYEIKLSFNDFKADFKKEQKHQFLKNGFRELSNHEKLMRERYGDKYHIHNLMPGNIIPGKRPNYFWYVCPADLISVDDIPIYSGLLYIVENTYPDGTYGVREIKKAPRLHKEHASDKQLRHLMDSLYYKYWTLRMYNHSNKER